MPEETKQEAVLPIQDINHFAALLRDWHTGKVSLLEHMLTIPDGTEMVIDGGDPKPLTGDTLTGFKAGLSLALMELGTLPFVYETEAEQATDEPVQTAS